MIKQTININSESKLHFSFPGESKLITILSVPMIIFMFIFFPLLLIFSWKTKGVLIGISILSIFSFVFYKRHIFRVYFFEDFIVVKKIFRKIQVSYLDIKEIKKNKEGFLPAIVYVVKTENFSFYFNCNDAEFDALKKLLISKNANIKYSKNWFLE